MDVFARLWTWTGHSFILPALILGFLVQGGIGPTTAPGVRISLAYWSLLLTLAVASLMCWTLVLYIRAAKAENSSLLIPPNTNFETREQRSRLVSWGTALVFGTVVLTALWVFSAKYHQSRIHLWDKNTPLADDFWLSRTMANAAACSKNPCYAMASRLNGETLVGEPVNQYIPYITDGLVIAAASPLLFCLLFVFYQGTRNI